jgi:hypothetical protein
MAGTKTKRRSCEGKRRNETEKAALDQLWTLVRNRGAIPGQYRVYLCDHCKSWHVGHKGRG